MKANEILQALNLQRNKETLNYTGKLFSLFTFLNEIKKDIVKAEIIPCDFTINDKGKALDYVCVKVLYDQSLISKFSYSDPECVRMNELISSNGSELSKVRDLLWKKRKNKDNSELENIKADKETVILTANYIKELLIKNENEKLQTILFSIEDMQKELQLFAGTKIQVTTNKGQYTFNIPKDNKFYYAICSLLNIPYEVKGAIEKKEVVKILLFNTDLVLDAIKKAAKFVSNDYLRPAMTCVCLDFSDNKLQVIGTDAHRMYYSKNIQVSLWFGDIAAKSYKPFQLLIQPDSLKKLAKSKPAKGEIYLTLFNDNTALINGIEVNLLPDTKYPDFKAVIPEYKDKMTFDRAQMITNVKKVLPYSNKSTSQVTFHINGQIDMNCQDVDFSFECDASMPYISKDFKDTDIAFNGNFLNEVLGVFKGNTVDMYSEGHPRRAAIFSDHSNTGNVLLMPLMIND